MQGKGKLKNVFIDVSCGLEKKSFVEQWGNPLHLFILLFLLSLAPLFESDFFGIVSLIFAGYLVVMCAKSSQFTSLVYLMVTAFLIRAILAIGQAYVISLPGSGADARTFERVGWEQAVAWREGSLHLLASDWTNRVYPSVIGGLYFWFGRVPIAVLSINVLLGCLTVVLVYFITREISENRRASIIAASMAAFFPTMNLFSAIMLREYFIIFPLVLSVYLLIRWAKDEYWPYFPLSIGMLLVSFLFHEATLLLGVGHLFLFLCVSFRKDRPIVTKVTALVILCGMILGVLVFFPVIINKLPGDLSLNIDPDYLMRRVAIAARGRTAYLTELFPTSHWDIAWQTPLRAAYFLFAPFIDLVYQGADLVGFVDGFFHLVLCIFGGIGVFVLPTKNRWIMIALVLMTVIFLVSFSWGTSNYGTAIRHRHKIVWLFIIFASVGVSSMLQISDRKKKSA